MLDRIGAGGDPHVIGKFKPVALGQIHAAGNSRTATFDFCNTIGTLRHFAATQQFGRFRSEADMSW
jgi:hypothetical protein